MEAFMVIRPGNGTLVSRILAVLVLAACVPQRACDQFVDGSVCYSRRSVVNIGDLYCVIPAIAAAVNADTPPPPVCPPPVCPPPPPSVCPPPPPPSVCPPASYGGSFYQTTQSSVSVSSFHPSGSLLPARGSPVCLPTEYDQQARGKGPSNAMAGPSEPHGSNKLQEPRSKKRKHDEYHGDTPPFLQDRPKKIKPCQSRGPEL